MNLDFRDQFVQLELTLICNQCFPVVNKAAQSNHCRTLFQMKMASAEKTNRLFVEVPSEDITCRKFDIAVKDTAIKSAAGFTVGAVFSLLYKRRKWPLILGFGVGLGMGIANFQQSLKQPLPRLYEHKIVSDTKPESNS